MVLHVVKDAARYGLAAAISSGAQLLSVPIISRMVAPEEYGRFLVAATTVAVTSILAVGWLTPSVVRFYSHYQVAGDVRGFQGTVLKLLLGSAIAILAAGVAAGVALPNLGREETLWFAILVAAVAVLDSCAAVLLSWFRAAHRVRWFVVFSIWCGVGKPALGIVFAAFGLKTVGLLVGWLVAVGTGLTAMLITARPRDWLALAHTPLARPIVRQIVAYGGPAVSMVLLVTVLTVSDRYVLGLFKGAREVAVYAASYEFAERGLFHVISVLTMAGGPLMFATWEQEGEARARELLRDLTSCYLLVGVPLTAALVVFARPIVVVLLPPAYEAGARVVPLVAIGAFMWGLMHSYLYGLALHKRSDLQAVCLLAAAVLNVLLNYLLVPRYGYMGAAWSTLLSYGVALLAAFMLSRRRFTWSFPFALLAKAATAAAVMALVSIGVIRYLTPPPTAQLAIGAVCAGATYLGMMLLMCRPLRTLTHARAAVQAAVGRP